MTKSRVQPVCFYEGQVTKHVGRWHVKKEPGMHITLKAGETDGIRMQPPLLSKVFQNTKSLYTVYLELYVSNHLS